MMLRSILVDSILLKYSYYTKEGKISRYRIQARLPSFIRNCGFEFHLHGQGIGL